MPHKTDLDALDRLHAAATKGEWKLDQYGNVLDVNVDAGKIRVSGFSTPLTGGPMMAQAKANTEALAALKNAYPAIAAELREARKRVRELEAEIEARDNSAVKMLKAVAAEVEASDARDRRMKALGAVETLQAIAAPYGGDATGCNPQILLDALIKRAAELEAAGEGEGNGN
jgi:hypothetical protein